MEIKGIGGGTTATVMGRVSIGKVRETGDVLVAPTTDPNLLSDMKRASAVVTDTGGAVCHAALVCTELGIPFVVGTRVATQVLKDDMFVEVDPVAESVTVLSWTS